MFIESWFAKLRERLISRMEFETLDQLRPELAAYVDRHHSGLDFRIPKEVVRLGTQLQKAAA